MARGIVESFADWARLRPDLEPDVIDTLVDLKASYLDDRQPGRWRSGDLTELLLEVIPRKVSADDDWYACVVPTTRAFLDRLHTRGELHRGSAPLASLLAELDDIETQFRDAVHDSSRFGMAKSILGAAGFEDMPERGELDDVMARFNSLPLAARDAALARFLPADDEDDEGDIHDDLPESLPGVRLAPVPELVAAAKASLTMRELQQLDAWLGAGRAVTATGVLTLKEARSLQEILGWLEQAPQDVGLFEAHIAEQVHDTGDDLDDVPARRPRSARDIPRLNDLWHLADVVGAIDIQRTRVYAGNVRPVLRAIREAPEQTPDEAVLSMWQAAFEAVLYLEPETGWFGLDPRELTAVVMHAAFASYEGDDHTLEQLVEEALEEPPSGDSVLVPPLARAVFGMYLQRAVGRLADLGATNQVDGPDDEVSLTPLGVHGVRTLVLAHGGDAPVVEDVAGLPADLVLGQILDANPELARELVLEWLAGRELRTALRELLLVVRGLPAALRHQALTVFVTVDDVPELLPELSDGDALLGPVVRGVLMDVDVFARLRLDDLDDLDDGAGAEMAAAVRGLSWAGLGVSPSHRDVLLVDSLARAVFELEEPVLTADVDSSYWSLLDEPSVVRMTGSEHAEADGVLAAIATGHPAGRLRKAAKKALHKRGTAGQ